MQFVNFGLAGLAAYVVYKALTTTFGEPYIEKIPDNSEFYGDDKMTFVQGLHAENRLEDVRTNPVAKNLATASINGALFEVNPDQLYPPQAKLPSTKVVSKFY